MSLGWERERHKVAGDLEDAHGDRDTLWDSRTPWDVSAGLGWWICPRA